MNEILTPADDTITQVDLVWQGRLDALVRGECSEDDFMDELSSCRDTGPDSAWSVAALLHQRYRRGQMPAELFRSIESKIEQRKLATLDDGTTIHFSPALAAPRVMTPRISPTAADPVLQPASPGNTLEPAAAAGETQGAAVESALPVPEIGCVLRSRYILESRLGGGGMGTVFKATDRYRSDLPEGNRYVAIKFLHENIDSRPELVSNLRREFHCAQALSHPNVVKVYELDQDGGVAFFTMEFLEGKLLSGVIGELNGLTLPRSDAWRIILEVGAGLAHAHARNVIHADLKPQNIMITDSGEVRILDFGASSAVTHRHSADEESRKSNSTALTPAYACCELLDGQQADPRDDLYALACLSYELLAGEHPFQRRRSTEARELGLVAGRPPGLTEQQWRALAMGLAWGREDRSISVFEWIAWLNPPATAAGRLAGSVARTHERSLQRITSSLRAAAALALLLLAANLWLWSSHQSFERKLGGTTAVAKIPANSPIIPDPAPAPAATPESAPATVSVAASATATVAAPAAASAPAPVAAPTAPPQTARPDAASSALRNEKINSISIANATYKVRPRQKFAEIRVRRSSGSVGKTSFVWWTEPFSAVAGVDYVPQAPITQLLSAETRMASLFIRVGSHASRKHSAMFYVVIGEPSKGVSLGRVARTAVLLPPSR